MDAALKDLAGRVEAAAELSPALAQDVAEALRHAGLPYAARPGTVEVALHLVETALPGWSVSLDGEARAGGRWTCSLRRSATRDDDAAVGVAHGRAPAAVILAALLRALAAGARARP